MNSAPPPSDEARRLNVLEALRVLDTQDEPAFEAIVRLAAQQTGCPIALLSLVDQQRLWLKARLGAQVHEVPSDAIFCRQTMGSDAVFVVPDALADARFAAHPQVAGAPQLRFYAGAPVTVAGYRLGTVCVMAPQARALDDAGRSALQDLAVTAGALLDARLQAQRVRAASRAGSDWLWETDEQGRLTWASDTIETHTGLPPQTQIGLQAPALHEPRNDEYRAAWERYLAARQRREPFSDAVADRETPLGRITVSISGIPMFDEQGRFKGYRGAARSVTAEVLAKAAAHRAEHLLRDAIESFNASVMITDADDRIVLSNATWRRVAGRYVDEAHPTWRATLERMVAAGVYKQAIGREEAFIAWRLSLPSREPSQHELMVGERWVLITDQVLPDGGVVHMSLDLNERKPSGLALSEQQAHALESHAQLGAMLAAVPDLWFLLDQEGRYLQCRTPVHPLLPLPFEQIRGRHVREVLPPHLVNLVLSAISAAQHSAQVQRIEYERVTPDGVARHLEVRISPMADGRTLHLVRDLTDLRTLERDLLVMQRVLEADASLPITVADATLPDQPLIYVNPAFERLSGYRREEIVGSNCRFLNAGYRDQPGLTELRHALAEGRPCTVVLRNARKDGSVFINELHIAPIRDAAGRITHFIGVANDVTERTRAAEKLRVSEELYRSVASAISDGLLVMTPDRSVAAINPAGCRILGVRQDEVIGPRDRLPFILLDEHFAELPDARHPVWPVLAGGAAVVDRPLALCRADGDLRWLSISCQPLRLAPGDTPFSVVVTFRDITEQRHAEQALAFSEERWKFALEGSGDGVWDYDEDTQLVFYSRRWKEMLGYAEHEIGESLQEWLQRVHPDDQARVLSEISRYRKGEIPAYEAEYRMRHRDGRHIWILDRGKIVERRADGSARRVVGTHSDITRQKLADQALRDKQAAELANRAKTEFLSRMSHEMRTPLNAVIGFAQLLKLQQADTVGNRPTYADHILQGGQHLLALINDVLDLQQVEEGRLSLNLESVSLGDVVARCIELLSPMAQARGVAIQNVVPSGLRLLADEQRLRQVLLNIASNAIKYNRPGGKVRWEVEGLGSARISLIIEDSGYGMTAEQMTRLFQPFERLGRETSAIEGTGLGLIIARRLVEEMDGSLSVASQPGAGTRVRIELPVPLDVLRSEHGELASALQGLPPDPQQHKESPRMRMLYVEDNRINAVLFEETLKLHGRVDLRIAEDGDEAQEIAAEWRPEVLVLDAHLPGLSGFEVLERLRELPGMADVPAFMCSADAMPEDVKRALAAGFVGYWTKPIDIRQVMSDLDALLQPADSTSLPSRS